MSRVWKLETGRKFRRPGGVLPALVAATFHTPVLAKLAPREQELAAIIYLNVGMTAAEAQLALSDDISNTAVRTILNRLVAKGLLRRRKVGRKFFYSPALLLPDIQERALERVATDFFEGSLSEAAHRLLNLLRKADPEALAP